MGNCWAVNECWSGWGASCGARLVNTDGTDDDDPNGGGRNLYAAVELADGWYGTAFPTTKWQRSWFALPDPLGSEVVPDFANAAAYVKFPALAAGGDSLVCVGASGSQYGDKSWASFGDSCVWYQLNYRAAGSSAQPRAALARVAVHDHSKSAQQAGSNRKFELTHCWLLEDENGDPVYWDAPWKLCGGIGDGKKVCVGADHFALVEYRTPDIDTHRVTYWTPGVAEATVTEWDNPEESANTSGWPCFAFDSSHFPIGGATQLEVMNTFGGGAPQSIRRWLRCGFIDLGTMELDTDDVWTNTGHFYQRSVAGEGGDNPAFSLDDMWFELIDFRATGNWNPPIYSPEDEEESEPIYQFLYPPYWQAPPEVDPEPSEHEVRWLSIIRTRGTGTGSFSGGLSWTCGEIVPGFPVPKPPVRIATMGTVDDNDFIGISDLPEAAEYEFNATTPWRVFADAHNVGWQGTSSYAVVRGDEPEGYVLSVRHQFIGSTITYVGGSTAVDIVGAGPFSEDIAWEGETVILPLPRVRALARGPQVDNAAYEALGFDHSEETDRADLVWPAWQASCFYDSETPENVRGSTPALWFYDGVTTPEATDGTSDTEVILRGIYWPDEGDPADAHVNGFCVGGSI